ncbi:hypothetical protein KC19_7G156800 [Ceratodon purpureus]|uniref:F-box domain-containing protein n=1 Tax=Ceratodon purpureus TaxID=3225 RepID=A0A8T0HAN0_CERPU|nr:hypothetical protein KC19_7G156800 [Ceratodon purpureus]
MSYTSPLMRFNVTWRPVEEWYNHDSDDEYQDPCTLSELGAETLEDDCVDGDDKQLRGLDPAPRVVSAFLDELPKELVTVVWDYLICKDEPPLLMIRKMTLLRTVCRGWRDWIDRNDDWIRGVPSYLADRDYYYTVMSRLGETEVDSDGYDTS